jgi:hypothetical protein
LVNGGKCGCHVIGRLVLAARRLMCGRYKTRPAPQVFFA